jgi:hypothetical protein
MHLAVSDSHQPFSDLARFFEALKWLSKRTGVNRFVGCYRCWKLSTLRTVSPSTLHADIRGKKWSSRIARQHATIRRVSDAKSC